MLLAVLWTVYSTKEYSPEELDIFEKADKSISQAGQVAKKSRTAKEYVTDVTIWSITGLLLTIVLTIYIDYLDKGLFILTVGIAVFGAGQLISGFMAKKGHVTNGFAIVMNDLFAMPQTMKQLALVQFFSWFPFFAMWTFMTAGITSFHYGTSDPTSALYNEGADWAGVLSSVYNGTTIFAAMLIPIVVRIFNLRVAHMINLFLGGIGFISFVFIKDPQWLILPMIGGGFAWASVLGVPYAILSNSLPANKMGVFMGVFNYFIVLPQILAASILGFMVSKLFDNQPIYALVVGGISMLIAGLMTLRIKDDALDFKSDGVQNV